MGFGFYKVGAVSMKNTLGDVDANIDTTISYIKEADKQLVELLVFPELSVTGYSLGDVFLREEIVIKAEEGIKRLLENTSDINMLICVGAPVLVMGRLFNCAVYLQQGELVGIVPKTYIPNYSEYYEKRWFASSKSRTCDEINYAGFTVPFNENLLLTADNNIVIGTEICEDLWVDAPPSGMLSRMGSNIIVNPSASNDIIGKREYRKNLVSMQSARCRCGYIYASCGAGESSTDICFSGHSIIADNGRVLNEVKDSLSDGELITALIDVDRCNHDKVMNNSNIWGEDIKCVVKKVKGPFNTELLPEIVDAYPFVPSDESSLTDRCNEILSLQAKGLIQRLRAINCSKVVVGISGGLDSTLALLVCVMAFDHLKLDRSGIHAITMPGFGTSVRTKDIADNLMRLLKVTYKTIDIKEACYKHLDDIGHDYETLDITYENTQARERTQILFDYSNMIGGIVIGTGDMSEMALGWCTYNGDHMSNYAVNIGVPKTLVKYLVRTYANNCQEELKNTLMDVFDLPISPELLPTTKDGDIAQKTEESVGKYDLQDFFLYHFLRNGENKEKMAALARVAFKDRLSGEEIDNTLDIFFKRFKTQQFKRSCIPDGIKIGTVALSPRGDLRLPSDLSLLV